MSDTTTITPEERQDWLKDAQPKSVGHYEPIDFEMDKRIRRLLTALEAAEAALLKEEVYSEELESQLQHAREENERLRAERDWLAGSMAEDGCPYLAFWADLDEDMRPDWCICTDTADDGFYCTGDPKECWQQEAARRAVAESEVRE